MRTSIGICPNAGNWQKVPLSKSEIRLQQCCLKRISIASNCPTSRSGDSPDRSSKLTYWKHLLKSAMRILASRPRRNERENSFQGVLGAALILWSDRCAVAKARAGSRSFLGKAAVRSQSTYSRRDFGVVPWFLDHYSQTQRLDHTSNIFKSTRN
jgi:hypothetical protein